MLWLAFQMAGKSRYSQDVAGHHLVGIVSDSKTNRVLCSVLLHYFVRQDDYKSTQILETPCAAICNAISRLTS